MSDATTTVVIAALCGFLALAAIVLLMLALRPLLEHIAKHLRDIGEVHGQQLAHERQRHSWEMNAREEDRRDRADAEQAAAKRHAENEDVAKAAELRTHNLRMVAAIEAALTGDLEPPASLSEAGAVGYRQGRDAARALLHAKLQG